MLWPLVSFEHPFVVWRSLCLLALLSSRSTQPFTFPNFFANGARLWDPPVKHPHLEFGLGLADTRKWDVHGALVVAGSAEPSGSQGTAMAGALAWKQGPHSRYGVWGSLPGQSGPASSLQHTVGGAFGCRADVLVICCYMSNCPQTYRLQTTATFILLVSLQFGQDSVKTIILLPLSVG